MFASSFGWYLLKDVIISNSSTILLTNGEEIKLSNLAHYQISELLAHRNKYFRVNRYFGVISSIVLAEDNIIDCRDSLIKILICGSLLTITTCFVVKQVVN